MGIDYRGIYEELAARLEYMEHLPRQEAENRAALYVKELRHNNMERDREIGRD